MGSIAASVGHTISKHQVQNTTIIRHKYQVIESTMDKAEELCDLLKPNEWYIVTAEEQTKGRGTHNRTWRSPADVNIYATFVFTIPKSQMTLLTNIPQVTAHAVIQTLNEFGLNGKLKWVNDVLVNGKKICGILCRSEFPSHLKDHIAVQAGIGINVNMPQEICSSIDQPVTSMLVETRKTFDKEDVLKHLQNYLKENIELLIKHEFSYFSKTISEKMEFIGEMIKVKEDSSECIKEGIMKGIDEIGHLILDQKGSIVSLSSGHIIPREVTFALDSIASTLDSVVGFFSDLKFPQDIIGEILENISDNKVLIKNTLEKKH